MIKIKHIFLITISLCFWSCSKDGLDEDREILIGKWKFHHTIIKTNSSGGSTGRILLNIDGSTNYSLEFKKKGKVIFCKDGNTEEKRIIFVDEFERNQYFYFDINLNNNTDNNFRIRAKTDTLITQSYFPFSPDEFSYLYGGGGSRNYLTYFIRE